jgi:hypothetical protein
MIWSNMNAIIKTDTTTPVTSIRVSVQDGTLFSYFSRYCFGYPSLSVMGEHFRMWLFFTFIHSCCFETTIDSQIRAFKLSQSYAFHFICSSFTKGRFLSGSLHINNSIPLPPHFVASIMADCAIQSQYINGKCLRSSLKIRF